MPNHVVVLLAEPEALSRAWSFREEEAAYAFASGLRVAHEGSRVQVIAAEDVPDRTKSPKRADRAAEHPFKHSRQKIRIDGKVVKIVRPAPYVPECPRCWARRDKILKVMPNLSYLSEMLAVMTEDDELYFCQRGCQRYFMHRGVPGLK